MPLHGLTDNLGDVMGARAHFEGPQLDVVLDGLVLVLAANQALGIKDYSSKAGRLSHACTVHSTKATACCEQRVLTILLLLLACVNGIHCDLVLGGISDEALSIREADIRRRGAVALRRRNRQEDKYQAKAA